MEIYCKICDKLCHFIYPHKFTCSDHYTYYSNLNSEWFDLTEITINIKQQRTVIYSKYGSHQLPFVLNMDFGNPNIEQYIEEKIKTMVNFQ